MKLRNTIFINGFINALNALIKEKMSMDKTFALRKLALEINDKAKIFEDTRTSIVDRYVKKDDEGSAILAKDTEGKDIEGQVQLDDVEGYNKDFMELVNLEEEYNFEKLMFTKEEAKRVSISTEELGLLLDLIEVE